MEEEQIAASIDGLFVGSLEAFTVERNALAARLKREGDSEASETVRSLKKPTVVAWAVNNAIQKHPDDIEELVNLRVSGLDPRVLGSKRKEIVDPLTRRAEAFLTERGHPVTNDTSRRISATLMAGSTGVEEEAFRRGRLSRELEPAGFDGILGSLDSEEPPASEDETRQAAQDRARQLSEAASEAEREAHRLAREAAARRREAEAAEHAATAAEKRAEESAVRAEEARGRAEEALDEKG